MARVKQVIPIFVITCYNDVVIFELIAIFTSGKQAITDIKVVITKSIVVRFITRRNNQ